jgi:hypothetical protein
MDLGLINFFGEIWQYKPIIVVLIVGFIIMFGLSVVDTHRHRQKEYKKRHKTKYHY